MTYEHTTRYNATHVSVKQSPHSVANYCSDNWSHPPKRCMILFIQLHPSLHGVH